MPLGRQDSQKICRQRQRRRSPSHRAALGAASTQEILHQHVPRTVLPHMLMSMLMEEARRQAGGVAVRATATAHGCEATNA